jgi:DNA-directed RNA polymerase subunit K/omega
MSDNEYSDNDSLPDNDIVENEDVVNDENDENISDENDDDDDDNDEDDNEDDKLYPTDKSVNKSKNNMDLNDDNDDNDDDDNDDNDDDDNDENNTDTDEDEYDSDDDDESSEIYTKFNNEIFSNYIQNTHPECLISNHKEIETLCTVVRDNNGNIIDDLHKSIPIITKYEKTSIISKRTTQLDNGSKPYIKIPHNIDSYIIASMEFDEKKIPFIIRRPIPNGSFEYWKLQDLIFL